MRYDEIRIGNFSGDLKGLVEKYSTNFKKDVDKEGFQRYILFLREDHQVYTVVVNGVNTNSVNYAGRYNLMVSVHGPVEERVKRFMDTLEEKMDIKLRPAPKNVRERIRDQMERK